MEPRSWRRDHDRSSPSSLSDGTVTGSTGILVDITARKRAEKELKEHQNHLGELVKECSVELTLANEQLRREITERKQRRKRASP
jgi:hypothetical protein